MNHRLLPLVALLLPASLALAGDAPLLDKPGKVITQPDLTKPLGSEWSVAKGKWEPANGVLTASELPEEHHAAVLHLATGPANIVFECEFKLDTAKVFYVGCDENKHVGRVVVMPKSIKIAEDSVAPGAKPGSNTLKEISIDLKPGDWQHLRVEYAGDQIAAKLNDKDLKAQHPYLATPKKRWWFAVGGGSAQIRNVKVSEGEPLK